MVAMARKWSTLLSCADSNVSLYNTEKATDVLVCLLYTRKAQILAVRWEDGDVDAVSVTRSHRGTT